MKHPLKTTTLILSALITPALAQDHHRRPPSIPLPRQRPQQTQNPPPAPAEITEAAPDTIEFPFEFRRIDASGNHRNDHALGTPDQPLIRLCPADYADASGEPAGANRPSAREISNAIVAQTETAENLRGATDFLWQWGQFVDHDLDETPTVEPAEAFDIPVPASDPWFDPSATGTATIPLNRSYYEEIDGLRQQVNGITAYIDASNVYGSDDTRAYALRRLDGSGMLKTTRSDHGDLLPYNEGGFANAPDEAPNWFLAGDVRANEQAALTAMHTLFVREHNHWARQFRDANPSAAEDDTYEFARMMVGAEIQHITYREFLPLLLGPEAIPPYQGFREEVDPTIANEFAAAAYRFGHSLLPAIIRRIGPDGSSIEAGDLPLAQAFFDPSIIEENGIDSLLRGLASQRCQELDGMMVDDVRNFLFGPPGAGGFDLASLNIQRGRDHGMPSYNQVRRQLGLPPARSFRDLNPDREVQQRLASVYRNVNDIDLWVGGLCEPHLPGAMVGPVFHRILRDQFIRVRDGDRFFYEGALAPELLRMIGDQSLATIIRRNTRIGDELQNNVFLVPGAEAAALPTPPQQTQQPTRERRRRR